MSKVLVTESNLQDIADAIRSKNEGTDNYRPGDMAAAILAIPVGGTLVSKTITQNGEYDPEDDNADGYSDVTVNVPNSYTAGDEGKVVSSGALVAQSSQTVTQNGTYDTTLINELIANISGGSGGGGIRYGTAFPDASTGEDGDVYLQISPAAVKNTSGQYISTGYSGNENSKYVIAFMITKAQSSQWPTPFGARTGDVANASLYSLAIASSNYSHSSAQWGNTSTIATGFPGATDLVNKMVVLEVAAGSERMEVDGDVYTHTSTHSGTVNGTSSMGIFAALKNGAYQSWSPVDGMQLYSFDIYENDVLVHSYRAALDGNDVACIYDSVSDEYLYHSGGGTLQYIEDGTIIKVLLKVNGAWQALAGSDIDDVDTSGSINLQSKTVTENGTVTPDAGYDGLSSVVVNVSGGSSTLIQKTITQNGTYNASADSADGYSQVIVDVQGGGSSNIEEWDLTQSLTGKLHGVPMTGTGVVIGSNGAIFDNGGDYLNIPLYWNGITIEIDVAEMNLVSGTHRRFVMGTFQDGLIYRSNGVWAFYSSSWVENGERDGAFFDNCTVKIHVDASGYWHIYKDNVLWWEPSRPLPLSLLSIGSTSGNSINNAVISEARVL